MWKLSRISNAELLIVVFKPLLAQQENKRETVATILSKSCFLFLHSKFLSFLNTLKFSCKWYDFKMTISEIRQSQGKYCLSPLTWSIWNSQIYRSRVEWWLSGPGGEGKMGSCCLMGIKFQLYKMDNSRDLLYSVVPIVSITILYTWKFVRRADLLLSVLTTIK